MRFLLLCACALLALFAGLIGLVRAQSQHDLAWGDFLLPPKGCPMPCWQGIRPGVTTGEEAIVILQAHPWTRRVITGYYNAENHQGTIVWAFNAPHPDGQIAPYQALLLVTQDVVSNITILTDIPFSAVYFLFGVPKIERWTVLGASLASGARIDHFAHYVDLGFSVYVPMNCPSGLAAAWGAQTTLQYGQPINRNSLRSIVQASHYGSFDPGWLVRHQMVCAP
jgi:hypothetical protein